MNHPHNNNMSWTEKTSSCGNHRWHKEKTGKSRRAEYVAAIIFNLIFLWVVNSIPGWHLPFIKDNFSVVQWILYVNILVQIASNFFMFMLDSYYPRRIGIILSETSGLIAILVLYYIFPFDFQTINDMHWMNRALPVFFIIAMVFSALKVFNNAWKLLFRK
jgi:nicotinamide riboside transporter PnuC